MTKLLTYFGIKLRTRFPLLTILKKITNFSLKSLLIIERQDWEQIFSLKNLAEYGPVPDLE
jgi:hypothetical protein